MSGGLGANCQQTSLPLHAPLPTFGGHLHGGVALLFSHSPPLPSARCPPQARHGSRPPAARRRPGGRGRCPCLRNLRLRSGFYLQHLVLPRPAKREPCCSQVSLVPSSRLPYPSLLALSLQGDFKEVSKKGNWINIAVRSSTCPACIPTPPQRHRWARTNPHPPHTPHTPATRSLTML